MTLYYRQDRPESEPSLIIDPSGELLEFCNDADEILEPIKDLYDALDDQYDRLGGEGAESQTEEEADRIFEQELRIARTMLGLLAEKAKKLSRLAHQSKQNVDTILMAIKNDKGGSPSTQS